MHKATNTTRRRRIAFSAALISGSFLFACGDESDFAETDDQDAVEVSTSVAAINDIPEDFELVLPETIKPFSGRSNGTTVTRSRSVTANDAVVGIRAGERSDDPCYLQLLYRDVRTGSETTSTYDKCAGSERSVRKIELPDGYLMTGVRVCLNRRRTRLKGIQLVGGVAQCIVNNNGMYWGRDFFSGQTVLTQCTQASLEYDVDFERANCAGGFGIPDDDWETERHCQPGSVVTGFQLNEVSGGGSRRMINGIGLICHQLLPD